jgi:hypothetical protein
MVNPVAAALRGTFGEAHWHSVISVVAVRCVLENRVERLQARVHNSMIACNSVASMATAQTALASGAPTKPQTLNHAGCFGQWSTKLLSYVHTCAVGAFSWAVLLEATAAPG